MEPIAVMILAAILVVGGLSFFIFLQFLGTVRSNQKSFRRVMEELSSLQKKVDGLNRPSPEKPRAEDAD
jgi:hypothetical protein